MKYVRIRLTPSGKNDVAMLAIDCANDQPIELVEIVPKYRLLEEMERLGERMIAREDVLEVTCPAIPEWARC